MFAHRANHVVGVTVHLEYDDGFEIDSVRDLRAIAVGRFGLSGVLDGDERVPRYETKSCCFWVLLVPRLGADVGTVSV